MKRRKAHFNVTFHFPQGDLPDAEYWVTCDEVGIVASRKGRGFSVRGTWREILGGLLLSKMGD